MTNSADGQDLIQGFFAALELRQIDRCEAVLAQLQAYSRTQPSYAPWWIYFSGILANERDHDWAEAEHIFGRLLATDLELPLHGRILLALGRTYEYQGRWSEAINVYERSLSVFAALDQPADQAKVWKQLAIVYDKGFTQGDFGADALRKAIDYCRRALDVLDSIADSSTDIVWLKGSIWNTLGLIYRNFGQWDQAIACYQHDMAICQSLNDRHGIGISYLNLGEVYQNQGRDTWPTALAAFQHALSLLREFNDRYLEADVLANFGYLYQEMADFEQALHFYDQAIQLIESMRAGISSEAARAGFFATTVDTYANAVLLCLATGRAAQAFDYVERARARAFLDLVATRTSELAQTIELRTITLAQVQAALPTDALILEYFTTGLVDTREGGAPARRHRFPPARTLIFAVTREIVRVHDAGLSPNDLRPSQLNSVVARHFLEPAIRRILYQHLITPVAELLDGRRLVYVVPHGPLHYIPFQALLAPDGATLLREEGPQLVYTPSASILFRSTRPMRERPARPCLALGYNGAGADRLRFAEEEARHVARLTDGEALVGSAPKKTVLFAQAAYYRMLHISCHGAFDPDSPLASALHLASHEELTALDILDHLRLGCDLVALSACESGLSRVRRGDELDGLVRAFLYAGASAVLCSVWRVDERSTHILMERFYQEIQAGADFAEALKHAQLYLMRLPSQDAQQILQRAFDAPESGTLANEQTAAQLGTDSVTECAGDYLKGLALHGRNGEAESEVGGTEVERAFADPYYWAPFILIATHDEGITAE